MQKKQKKLIIHRAKQPPKRRTAPAFTPTTSWFVLKRWVQTSLWRVGAVAVALMLFLSVTFMYVFSQYYIAKHADEPFKLGTTFVPDYARYFELDPEETLEAMFKDLGVKNIRFVSYWKNHEPERGVYNFDELDWQFKLAEKYGANVSLSIGLRQPRWPECHMPQWAEGLSKETWSQELKTYMGAVINRYQDSPALESYQLENEFFLDVFGICPDFSRERLVDEYNFVKAKDPHHPIIVSMSNNAIGTPLYEPTPDMWGVAVYKRVWDQNITKRYFEYPLPAWYYAFRAGWTEATRGRPVFIHELQTEPWMPMGFDLKTSSLEEQDKSMNADMLKHRIEYGRATGMRKVDLWGTEWWYWRMVKKGDSSLWDVAKAEFSQANAGTGRYKVR